MHDELVAWLRSWSEMPAHCECYESCDECDKQDLCDTFTNESIITKAGEAADAIEELSKPRWIPVTERLPNEHIRVLVINDDAKFMVAERAEDDWWYQYCAYDVDRWDALEQGVITHWMPLPSTEGLNET